MGSGQKGYLLKRLKAMINPQQPTDNKEKYFKSIFLSAIQSMIVIDEKGFVLDFNPAAEKMFGYRAKEIIGKNITVLMHKQEAEHHHKSLEKYLATGETHIIGKGRQIIAKHKDGYSINVFLSVSEVKEKEGKIFIGLLHDLSELDHANKTAEYQLKLLQELIAIQEKYIEKSNPNKLFDSILNTILHLTRSEYGFIGLILLDENKTRYLKTLAITNIAWNKETQEFYENNAPEGLEFKNLDSLFGYTIRTGEFVLTNDPKNHPESCGIPKGHPPLKAYLGVPIYGKNGLIAMLGVANCEAGYTTDDIEKLKPTTRMLASLIEATKQSIELEKLAKSDPLTQLSNRTHFSNFLLHTINKHKKNKKLFALVLMDLDKFKTINDSYGHPAGDFVLSICSNKIRNHLKKTDLGSRIGGDEFALILTDISSKEELLTICKSLESSINEKIKYENSYLEVGVSMGVATFPDAGMTPNELLTNTDFALYYSKKHKEIAYFDKDLENLFNQNKQIKIDIISALENNDIDIHIQPILNMKTNTIDGGEALIRWKHPKLGNIPAFRLANACEDLDISDKLNHYVLSKTIQFFDKIKPQTKHKLSLNINLSPYVKNWPEHILTLSDEVKACINLKNHFNLYFEVTEAQYANISHTINDDIKLQIKNQGIRFALDDFGTRYSSFNRIMEYPCDCIKIDVDFTKKLTEKNNKTVIAIFESIKFLCDKLDIRCIVEGMETEAQADKAISLDFTYGQGYYYYKPMPLQEFSELIKSYE